MAIISYCYKWFIIICIYIETAYCNCYTDTSSRRNYQLASNIEHDAILSHKMKDTLNNCLFGKYHSIFDKNTCFDHCTVRGRSTCLTVQTSDEGCRFCLLAVYDSSRADAVDFHLTYVTADALESTLFWFLCIK